ncbi:membrane protein implicated in regulation of membrane protease activity [Constrictibacter sp. MBR-5]|jgi:membrane protein implicated in regulation of membrane protease activity|uniref:NfeD family protein n=1 Tax=Constrictibacter sp. MBR-5 TaxID=3156467 RepID=UPI003394C12D
MLEQIDYWHWMAFGALLGAVEILVPGVFFLWIGIAAVVIGFVLLLLPALPWGIQLVLFAVLSVASVYGGRGFFRVRDGDSDHPDLNRRGRKLVGQHFTLDAPSVDGRGRVKVGDGVWSYVTAGGDLAAGTRVRVVGVEGAVLRIEALP